MPDTTPNSLEPTKKVNVARMSRWPLYAVLLAGLFLLGILVYSVNFAHNQEQEQAKAPKVDIKEEERPLLMGEGRGLALAPPAGSPAIAGPAPQKPEGSKREPLIVVQGKQEQPDQYRQELENLRRMKAQAQLTALSAPLGVKKASESSAQQAAMVHEGQRQDSSGQESGRDPYGIRESSYDPSADKDKEAFFSRADSSKGRQDGGQPRSASVAGTTFPASESESRTGRAGERDLQWILPHTRTAGQPLELKTGGIIPGVMVTGINSDLPGNIIAQVSQNVFDTATGRQLLVPQGAKLFGVYDSRVIYGQERVLVAWNRIVFPDGSAVTLGAMPGSDMAGNAGYTDEVNNHYLRIFGSAILMSMITGGMSYSMDALNTSGSSNSGSNTPTLQEEMGSALAAQLGQVTMQLLQKNLNIKPTLEIRPGYQFNVIVTKDMVFQKPYKAER